MNLEIVTPDSKVYEGEITSIALPGIDGSFQILNNHAPIVSALGTGKMKIVDKENQTQEASELFCSDLFKFLSRFGMAELFVLSVLFPCSFSFDVFCCVLTTLTPLSGRNFRFPFADLSTMCFLPCCLRRR